jgi:hypothetical protein
VKMSAGRRSRGLVWGGGVVDVVVVVVGRCRCVGAGGGGWVGEHARLLVESESSVGERGTMSRRSKRLTDMGKAMSGVEWRLG